MGARVSREDYEWVYTEEPHATRRKEIMGRLFFLIFKINLEFIVSVALLHLKCICTQLMHDRPVHAVWRYIFDVFYIKFRFCDYKHVQNFIWCSIMLNKLTLYTCFNILHNMGVVSISHRALKCLSHVYNGERFSLLKPNFF